VAALYTVWAFGNTVMQLYDIIKNQRHNNNLDQTLPGGSPNPKPPSNRTRRKHAASPESCGEKKHPTFLFLIDFKGINQWIPGD